MVMGITAVATRAADFTEVVFAAAADSMVEVGSTVEVGSMEAVGSMAVADPTVVVDAGNALPRMKDTTAGSIELPAVVLLISRTPSPGLRLPSAVPSARFLARMSARKPPQ
jgi:hypothetical protein